MDITMTKKGIILTFNYKFASYTQMKGLIKQLQVYEAAAVKMKDETKLEIIRQAQDTALAALGDVHLKGKAK